MNPSQPLTISEGLPGAREEWPEEVLRACSEIRSGDVIPNPPFFYYADPRYAIWQATYDYSEGSNGPEIVDACEYGPPYGVVTSQTCDIGEVGFVPPLRPWVMVAPVFDMSGLERAKKKAIASDRYSKFLIHLPAIASPDDEFWVADLRIEMPVEKSALVGVRVTRSFAEDRQQNLIGRRVADLRARPAWADSIIDTSTQLSRFLTETKRTNRNLWDAVRGEFIELGARVDSLESPSFLQLCAFTSGGISEPALEWWMEFYDRLVDNPPDGLVLHRSITEDLERCSVARYRDFSTIPFREFGRE